MCDLVQDHLANLNVNNLEINLQFNLNVDRDLIIYDPANLIFSIWCFDQNVKS